MIYFDQLRKAMALVAEHPDTLFVGQAVRYSGQRAFGTFADVPMERRIEMPVAEDFQAGFCTGLALEGYIPLSFYPRFDFLLIAANAIVNHLDKVAAMSDFKPKVIFRTAVGTRKPLDPGLQHIQNHTHGMRQMLKHIPVEELKRAEDIMPAYKWALNAQHSVIMVEYMER